MTESRVEPKIRIENVSYAYDGRRALQDLLTAIRLNTPVAELGHARLSNGERHLRTLDDLADELTKAGLVEGERVWRLPMAPERTSPVDRLVAIGRRRGWIGSSQSSSQGPGSASVSSRWRGGCQSQSSSSFRPG